jgi:hypothetical protein
MAKMMNKGTGPRGKTYFSASRGVAESGDMGSFAAPIHRWLSFGFLRPTPQGELPAYQLPIAAVDHSHEVRPSICTAGNVSQIHRPPTVARFRAAHRGLHPWSRPHLPLMHQPSLSLQKPINPFPIDVFPKPISKQRPQSPIPVGRMLLDEYVQLLLEL